MQLMKDLARKKIQEKINFKYLLNEDNFHEFKFCVVGKPSCEKHCQFFCILGENQ